MTEFLEMPWVQRTYLVVGGLVIGLLVELIVVARARRLAEKTRVKWDDLIVTSIHGVAPVLLGAAGVYLALGVGEVDPWILSTAKVVLTVLVMGAIVFAGMRLAGGAVEVFSGSSDAIQSSTLVVNLARMAVAILGAIIILQNLGIEITPLVTALGIGGLAVALALQDTLGNLFAGIQIIISRQVRQSDYVRLSTGEEGWVMDVKGRNTTIHTFPDGNLLAVPNSVLASSIVKNFSLPRTALWVSIPVGVSYDSDLEHVERVALEVAHSVVEQDDGSLSGHAPLVRFHTFGDSSIDFEVRLMVREFESQGPVRHEFIKRLHRRFNEEGIEIPFPIRTVVMKNDTG